MRGEPKWACGSEDGLNIYVFHVMILVVKGEKLALALMYLGSSTHWLYECMENMISSVGRYDVVNQIDSRFQQMVI